MPTNFPISEPVQFSFAGSRAAQADRTLLTQAQDRAERGEDAETIRRDTGWHQGVEGRWRFEIADNSAGFNMPLLGNLHSGGFASRMIEHVSYRKDADGTYQLSLAPLAPQKVSDFVSVRGIPKHMLLSLLPMSAIEAIERDEGEEDFIGANLDDAKRVRAPFEFTGFNALPLDAVMDHPTLFAAYPALRDVMVAVDPKLGNGATLGTTDYADGSVGQVIQVGNPRLNNVGGRILHEVQHAIQDIEGFAPGGRIRQLTDEQLADGTGLSAGERYRRLAGEVEARNTQARQQMSDHERALHAPEATADVPKDEWIVPQDANAFPVQTKTATFKAWFGESKVVTADGQPLMVYHGRDGDFSVFNTLGGAGKTSDTGSFFADKPKAADTYAHGAAPNVAPVFLSLKSPAIIDAKGRNWNSIAQSAAVDLPAIEVDDQADEDLLAGLQGREAETAPKRKVKAKKTTVRKMFDGEWDYPDDTATTDDIARWARKNGYDGLIVRNVKDRGPSGRFASDEAAEPGTIYVSFHPEQIKSAIGNNGQFDGNNPDIRFSMADTAEAPLAAQTQTEAFRQWFGENSTLTNPDGSPMVLFHGTGSQFTQFRRSKTGAMGPGVYLGDSRDVAEVHAGNGKGAQTVMAVYARGKYLSNRQWTGYIHAHGWSGAEAAATADGWSGVHDQMFENAVCVWDPAQIKSATDNNGQFDGENPDIRFSFAEPAKTGPSDFQDWFADSKVVTPDGQPLVVYHGTVSPEFSEFNTEEGAHFGDLGQATDRISNAAHGRILPVHLSIKNPKRVQDQGSDWLPAVKQATQEGHDGIGYLNRGEGLEDPDEDAIADAQSDDEFKLAAPDARDSFIAFKPEQIRSAAVDSGELAKDAPELPPAAADAAHAPAFREDIPDEDWLRDQVEYVSGAGRNAFGVPRMNKITGSFSDSIMVPTELATAAPGQRGEQSNVRTQSVDAIRKILRETGRMPTDANGNEDAPYIEVGYDGKPWVREGNHRIMAAAAEGWEYIPAQVRYFDGGQRLAGPWSPSNLLAATSRASERASVPAVDQPQTEAFKRWFEGSRVVDDAGQPLVVYHGTDKSFSVFDARRAGAGNDKGMRGTGFYFSPNEKTAGNYGANLFPVYVNIRNPFVPSEFASKSGIAERLGVDESIFVYSPGSDFRVYQPFSDVFASAVQRAGYDGVLYPQGQEVLAFRSDQIKSATDNNGQFDGDNPDIRFSQSAEFVSQLMRSIEGAPVRTGSMPADQWIAWIQSSAPRLGIKKDEIEWSGVLDFLALHGHEKVTQGELVAYIEKNGVRVAETTMGGPKRYESLEPEYAEHSDSWLVLNEEGVVVAAELETREDAKEWIENYQADFPAGPKYGEYVVPGGQNYREVLITLPAKSDTPFYEALSAKYGKSGKALWNAATPAEREIVDREAASMKVAGQTGYKSGHWSQRNILVHLRVDDRVDAEGNKVLMVHEIQSDWGQDGKKKGIQSAYRQRAPEVTAKVMTGHEFVAERSMPAAAAAFWLQGRNDILHDLGKPPVAMEDSFTIIYEGGIPKIVKDGAQDTEAVASTHRRRYDAMLASGRQNHEATQVEKVPNAPFIADTKAWVALAIKRAIMMAVEGDYDKVSFITGKQAAGIYDLSKQVEIISVHANLDGTYDIGVEMGETDKFFRSQTPAQVEATIGKALAEKGIKAADDWLEADKAYRAALKIDGISEEKLDALRSARSNIQRDFSGDDLKLGGEGMITFYDQIIPQVARDVLKKLGGEGLMGVNFGEKVDGAFGVYDGDELVFSSDSEENAKEYRLVYPNDATVRPLGLSGAQPGFTITPALRARVLAGVPLFSRVSLPDASAHAEHSAHLARMQALLDADPLFADLQDEHVQDFQRILLAYGAPAIKGAHALDWTQVPLEDREAYFAREIELRQYPGHAEYADLAATLPESRRGKSTISSVQAAIRALINDTGVLGQRLGSIVACTAQDIRTKWVPLIGLQTQASQKARRAQGFYDKTSSTTFLITDNIAAGDELGVVAHELMHKHGEAILGVDGWEQLHGAIKGWASARPGSPERVIHDEATRRVATVRPADTSAESYSSQELFPYAVEVAVKMGIQPSWDAPKDSAGGWLARVRSTLCSVWEKISNKPRDMTAQDLVTLAYGIAHRERTLSDADRCDFRDATDPLSSASFREWFADSKAIDATGNPLVLYHGTNATFETFDYAKIGKNGRDEGAGFYFTDNHKVSAGYGDPMSVYLSIQKPLPYDAKPFCRAVTGRLVRRLAAIEAKSTGGELADGFLSNYGDVRYEGLEKVVRQAVGSLMNNESAIDQMGDLASSGASIALVNQAVFDVTGYDSIVSQGYSNCGDADNRIFVAFFPTQIKSASNNCGQFASDSTSIFHSVAGQSASAATSAWGRFKPAALAAGMACLESNLPVDNSSIVALIEDGLLPSNYAQFPSRDNSECEEQTWDRPRFN